MILLRERHRTSTWRATGTSGKLPFARNGLAALRSPEVRGRRERAPRGRDPLFVQAGHMGVVLRYTSTAQLDPRAEKRRNGPRLA
jgi:hypothetical protein